MEPVFAIAGVILLVLIIRLFAGGMDGDRIEEHIRSRGGRLTEKNWSPFGKGWFGSEHQRIYEIRYFDADGNEHQATCKTSMLGGVYFTEDNIVSYPKNCTVPDTQTAAEEPDEFVESLIDENQKLREEIKRLRRHDDR